VAAVLERLMEREIRARDEAERVIRVHVAPELQGQPFGEPDGRPGESNRSYARRSKTIDTLFGSAGSATSSGRVKGSSARRAPGCSKGSMRC
jgi:hypothetical protein